MDDEPSSIQPLTEENLRRIQCKGTSSTASNTYSDYLPTDRLERAKRRVYGFLWGLRGIGSAGDRIREEEDVYMAGQLEVRYRGNTVPEPDLQDPSYWEGKRQRLEDKWRPVIRLERARRAVCRKMMVLWRFGREGRKIVADDELEVVGKNDVRYRGNGPEPDFQDPAYWEAKAEYLESKYRPLYLARYPPAPPCSLGHTDTSEHNANVRADEYIRHWGERRKGIETWADTQPRGTSLPRPRTPASHDPSENPIAGSVEDSIGDPSEAIPYFRWHRAYMSVYERMIKLWDLGIEGREIVKNDELRVVGKYDVRYRRSKGHKPNLLDPAYWEAKLQYFTENYLSIFCRQVDQHSSPSSKLINYVERVRDPDPTLIAHAPSSIPSRVESLRPSSELARAVELQEYKPLVYDIMSPDYFQREGRHILENDELYIAGEDDVRYRHRGSPEPDLQDPGYWQVKLMDFYSHYYRRNQTSVPLMDSPSQSSDHSKGFVSPMTQSSRLSQRAGKSCPPVHLHTSQSTSQSTSQKTSIPGSQATRTPVIELPRGPKRKSIHLDNTDRARTHPPLQPFKRSKLGTGLASKVSTTAIESSPTTSEQLTKSTMSYHRRSSGRIYDWPSQSPGERDVIEELDNRAMRTTSQCCRRQRKTYKKERASRRLAGQLPEFGMLPERGQKKDPHRDRLPKKLRIGKAKKNGVKR